MFKIVTCLTEWGVGWNNELGVKKGWMVIKCAIHLSNILTQIVIDIIIMPCLHCLHNDIHLCHKDSGQCQKHALMDPN